MAGYPWSAPSVIHWPRTVQAVLPSVLRAAREIWRGIDTWGAVTHGVIPLSGDRQEQLAVRGDIDALTARAKAGDEYAAVLLARLRADRSEGR